MNCRDAAIQLSLSTTYSHLRVPIPDARNPLTLAPRHGTTSITLIRAGINDKCLQKIAARFPDLTAIDVSGNLAVTDAGVASLIGLKHLVSLNLGDAAVTDEGLRPLPLARLRSLAVPANCATIALATAIQPLPSIAIAFPVQNGLVASKFGRLPEGLFMGYWLLLKKRAQLNAQTARLRADTEALNAMKAKLNADRDRLQSGDCCTPEAAA